MAISRQTTKFTEKHLTIKNINGNIYTVKKTIRHHSRHTRKDTEMTNTPYQNSDTLINCFQQELKKSQNTPSLLTDIYPGNGGLFTIETYTYYMYEEALQQDKNGNKDIAQIYRKYFSRIFQMGIMPVIPEEKDGMPDEDELTAILPILDGIYPQETDDGLTDRQLAYCVYEEALVLEARGEERAERYYKYFEGFFRLGIMPEICE